MCVHLCCTVCDLMTPLIKAQHNILPLYIGCIPITYYGILCLSSTCVLFALSKISPFTSNPTILRSYSFFMPFPLENNYKLSTSYDPFTVSMGWVQVCRLVPLQHSESKLQHLPLIAQWPTRNFQWAVLAKQGGTTPQVSRIPQRLIS